MRLTYAAREGIEARLRQLVDLERDCCPFADWTVRGEHGRVILDVAAEGDGVAAVRAMFGRS